MSLGKTLSCSGNLSESHTIGYYGDTVGIGVDIINSSHYDYTYLLKQDDTDISASEQQDVDKAEQIHAYTIAGASDGHAASSKLSIVHGSRKGFSNGASIANGKVSAGQRFSSAYGDAIKAGASGSDETSTSGVDTGVIAGTISGHSDKAETTIGSQKAYVEQSGQINLDTWKYGGGSFNARSYFEYPPPEDNKETIRTSDYCTKYDFKMPSSFEPRETKIVGQTTGGVGYYVDLRVKGIYHGL